MPAVSHVFRRGAVYYWRRRIPAAPDAGPGCVLILSLGTKDQDEARRLAAALTHMSETVLEEARRGRLTPSEAQAIMLAVALEQIETLKRAAIADRALNRPEPMSGERADRILGAAYRLLAERGGGARLAEDETEFLRSCHLPPSENFQVATMLEVLRRQNKAPPPNWKVERLLGEHAPNVERTPVAYVEALHAFYRGKAAACLDTDARWGGSLEADMAAVRSATSVIAADQSSSPSPVAEAEPPLASAPPAAPAAAEAIAPRDAAPSGVQAKPSLALIPSTISGLTEKLVTTRSPKRWTTKTARQMTSTADLLIRVVGHDEFRRLRQEDFAVFRDVLDRLPVTFGKSAKDKLRPLADILRVAERPDRRKEDGESPDSEKRGRDAGTVNRYFTQLNALLKYAAGYGVSCAEPIDLSFFAEPTPERARDDRPPMTDDDIRALLQAPVWLGCAGAHERLTAGDVVIQDALYWAPLIAIYTLARREEICGLMIDDVVFDALTPHFRIAPNRYRRLKNAQSTRKIPIHPELLRLGLRAYVGALGTLGYDLLFPELLPASGRAPLGDQFHDDWSPLLKQQLSQSDAQGKVFHSIRHWGNQTLSDRSVSLEWRRDIMGHAGKSETDERYREATHLKRLFSALKKLPQVTANLKPFPIRLRDRVVQHVGRTPRVRRGRQAAPDSTTNNVDGSALPTSPRGVRQSRYA